MLKIRLQRIGRKHEPAFRLVLTDSKNSTKSGKLLEVLGSHDFRGDKKPVIEKERVLYWMSKGVKPSNTVHNLFVSEKIIEGKKINVLPKKTVTPSTDSGQVKPEVDSTSSPQEVKEEVKAEEKSA